MTYQIPEICTQPLVVNPYDPSNLLAESRGTDSKLCIEITKEDKQRLKDAAEARGTNPSRLLRAFVRSL